MPIFNLNEMKKEPIEPEYSSAKGTFIRGEQIAGGMFFCPAGTEIKPHSRDNEQIHCVLKGKAKYCVDGDEKVVGPNEVILIQPQIEYSAKILEDFEAVGFEDIGSCEDEKQQTAKSSPFFKWEEMDSDFITPEYSRGKGPTISGKRIEIVLLKHPVGPPGKPHSHPNEQIQITLKGKVNGSIGGENYSISGPGYLTLRSTNMEHSVEIIEEFWVLNCKNIVPNWNVYHARWEK